MKVDKMFYEAPIVEITEIMIEQGIAQTGSTNENLDWNDEMGWE